MERQIGSDTNFLPARRVLIAAIATVTVPALALAPYALQFGPAFSNSHQRWAEFGSYLSGTLGIAVSAATLVVAIYASLVFPKVFESQRAAAERKRQTIELSHKLFDKDFYTYVSAPAWEIAVKWLYWTGVEGDEYRRQVCGGMFLYSYPEFSKPSEANSAPYQNLIRFRHHFLPYDAKLADEDVRSDVITQLSEHQVLTVWIQFWIHLHALIKAELVDLELCQSLFREWYGSWLKFMIQFRTTGQMLANASVPDGTLLPGTEPNYLRLHQLSELEDLLFAGDQEYAGIKQEASAKAKELAMAVIKCHNNAHRERTEASL
jgi:hypothetical protein